MKQKSILLFILFIVVFGAFLYLWQQWPILETQPNQRPPETSVPVETEATNKNPTHPLLVLDYPQENSTVKSPLSIAGTARGPWFFEATFPVVLTNWDGLIIAEGYATAQGDWMTEDFVPFSAELTFSADTSVSNRGSLILQKANASGLHENDDAYEITVFFE